MISIRRVIPMVGVAAASWLVMSLWDPVRHTHLTDIPVYRDVAAAIAAGQLPYRDFDVEYPPLAAALMYVARLIPTDYATGFSLVMFVALATTLLGTMATAAALRLSPRRQTAAGLIVATTPLLLGDLVATRFDLALTALLAWTLWAAVTDRFAAMWLLLAAAIALKLVPVALIPVLVIWQRHRTGAWPGRTLLPSAAVSAIVWIPFLMFGASGIGHLFRYHLDRPLQIESLGGSYLLGLRALADIPLSITTGYGSQNVSGLGVDVITAITTGLQIASIAAVAVVFALFLHRAPRRLRVHGLVSAVGATMALLVVTGKVLSPQFVLWLLPACVLIVGPYGALAAGAVVVVFVTTQIYFPYSYWDLVAMEPGAIAQLVVRNVALIVLAAAAFPRIGWWERAVRREG